jgi:hypothetical protein
VRDPLLVAAGGGGDAIAALFIHHALSAPGSERPVIASFSWDRFLLDPQPGPRTPDDFRGLRPITPRNWEVTRDSSLISGARSTLPLLARLTPARLVLLDPRGGAQGLREQLAELASALTAPAITLVDAGGDITGQGDEPELLSPLADSITLAALDGLGLPANVVVAGPGLDGELPAATVTQRCSSLAATTGQLTPADIRPCLPALNRHPSEATTLLAAATLGVRGLAEIRDRGALVPVTGQSSTFHVIEPGALLKINLIAGQMTGTTSLDDAEQVTLSIRGTSELSHERRKASGSPDRAAMPGRAELAKRYAAYRRAAASRGVSILTFRHLAEVIGLTEYGPSLIRDLAGPDAHPDLAICQLPHTSR